MTLPIVSLFSGCGGLDLGFIKAGFEIIWANEYDNKIWKTFENNFPETFLDKRDIRDIPSGDIPDCLGIIGGPPCQSWSEAGAQRGINDSRGKLFFEYARIINDKQPKFFLAENVSGILALKHREALDNILVLFSEAGYFVDFQLLNAYDYGVPQDRKRVIIVGYHKSLGIRFDFLIPKQKPVTLKDSIWDLRENALPATKFNKSNYQSCLLPNHEFMTGGFSTIYMSRNRVRSWNEPSFTIQAGGRHAPIHPQANKMIHVGINKFEFDRSSKFPYRRLSVRECARIQTFPDTFIFDYDNLSDAYKMIGNAVPVNFALALANEIRKDLENQESCQSNQVCNQKLNFKQLRLALD
ncbi:MAG: DNA cytosine methyltransferase [Anaerolineaceae bacterium]